MQSTLDHDAYIEALRPLTLEEKQAEYLHCREKACAAAVLHDFELAEYYLEVLNYLSLFVVVDEVIDITGWLIPVRRPIDEDENEFEK